MKANYLFLAALLASAIAAPIETFIEDNSMAQQTEVAPFVRTVFPIS